MGFNPEAAVWDMEGNTIVDPADPVLEQLFVDSVQPPLESVDASNPPGVDEEFAEIVKSLTVTPDEAETTGVETPPVIDLPDEKLSINSSIVKAVSDGSSSASDNDTGTVREPDLSTAATKVQPERVSLKREVLRMGIRTVKMLGSGALLVAGLTVSVLTASHVYGIKDVENNSPVAVDQPTQDEVETVEFTPATEAPTTTTTAQETITPIEPSFDPLIGDKIGTLVFPNFCNYSIDFTAYAESENARQENGGLVGTGAAVIDQIIPDPSPDGLCPAVEEQELRWEAETGLDYTTRDQLYGNNYLPIGGYAIGDDGDYISVRPGMEGVSILSGHRMTRSAANANNALLRPGDPAQFYRADGKALNYVVIENQQIPDNESPEDALRIRNYTHPNFDSILAVYGCADEDGNAGSGDYRIVTYLGLTGSTAYTSLDNQQQMHLETDNSRT